MKKLAFSLLACLICVQTIQADAPAQVSPKNLSLQHYETLTSTLSHNPEFQNILSEGEFITNLRIQRRSINTKEGNVYVNVTTLAPKSTEAKEPSAAPTDEAKSSSRQKGRLKNKMGFVGKTYMATLLLTPSEEGTPSVTVVSIEPMMRHCKTFIGKDKKNCEKPSIVKEVE